MKMFVSSSTKSVRIFCFALVCHVVRIQARVKTNTEVDCDLIQSQPFHSLSDMTGEWSAVEILEHVLKSRPTADSCIRMEIRETDTNNIELVWKEDQNFEVIYKFTIRDANSRGVWTSLGSQTVRGTNLNYEQFAGSVYVLKASKANIVLTFCSKPHVLFTVILTKKPTMNKTELNKIHDMVNRLGAPIPVEIKKFCRNDAADILHSVALILVLCLISLFTYTLEES